MEVGPRGEIQYLNIFFEWPPSVMPETWTILDGEFWLVPCVSRTLAALCGGARADRTVGRNLPAPCGQLGRPTRTPTKMTGARGKLEFWQRVEGYAEMGIIP